MSKQNNNKKSKRGVLDQLSRIAFQMGEKDVKDEAGSTPDSKLWNIETLDANNFDTGYAFVSSCIDWLRRNEGTESTVISPSSRLLAHLQEGIFRKAGAETEIQELQQQFVVVDYAIPPSTDVHTVSSLLKRYFRQMKEPVIPFVHYQTFIGLAEVEDPEEKLNQLAVAFSMVPPMNRKMIQLLFTYLFEVSQHQEATKMTTNSLAIVWAPNIVRPAIQTPLNVICDSSKAVSITDTLIISINDLFNTNVSADQMQALADTMRNTYQRKQDAARATLMKARSTIFIGKDEANQLRELLNSPNRGESGHQQQIQKFFTNSPMKSSSSGHHSGRHQQGSPSVTRAAVDADQKESPAESTDSTNCQTDLTKLFNLMGLPVTAGDIGSNSGDDDSSESSKHDEIETAVQLEILRIMSQFSDEGPPTESIPRKKSKPLLEKDQISPRTGSSSSASRSTESVDKLNRKGSEQKVASGRKKSVPNINAQATGTGAESETKSGDDLSPRRRTSATRPPLKRTSTPTNDKNRVTTPRGKDDEPKSRSSSKNNIVLESPDDPKANRVSSPRTTSSKPNLVLKLGEMGDKDANNSSISPKLHLSPTPPKPGRHKDSKESEGTDDQASGSPGGSGSPNTTPAPSPRSGSVLSPRNSAPRHSPRVKGTPSVSVSALPKISPRAKLTNEQTTEDSDSPRTTKSVSSKESTSKGIRRDPSLGHKPSVSPYAEKSKLETPNIYVSTHIHEDSKSNDTVSKEEDIPVTTTKSKLTKKNSLHHEAGSRPASPGTPRRDSVLAQTDKSKSSSGGIGQSPRTRDSQPNSPKGGSSSSSQQEGTPVGGRSSTLKEQQAIMEKKMAEDAEVQDEIEKLMKELQ